MSKAGYAKVMETASQLHSSVSRLFHRLRVTRSAGGLSMAKLAVLSLLYRQRVTTATDLACCLGIQPQSLTRLLAESEEERLIRRQPDKKDKRQTLIEITPAGSRILAEEAHKREKRLAAAMVHVLTPTEQQLIQLSGSLLDRLAEAIEPEKTNRAKREGEERS
jgi:DNA-binding MarR family transcriptional regulator